MSYPLEVKVFKKSKSATVPEHIVVKRPATHDLVHMYFHEGTLVKFVHMVRNAKIRAKTPYAVAQEFAITDGEVKYLEGPIDQNFFCFFTTPPWNSSSIGFKSSPEGIFSDLFIETDLKFNCVPNSYIRQDCVADMQEVYATKKEEKTEQIAKEVNQHVTADGKAQQPGKQSKLVFRTLWDTIRKTKF